MTTYTVRFEGKQKKNNFTSIYFIITKEETSSFFMCLGLFLNNSRLEHSVTPRKF
jgi:predicted cupin superfamily sugar epimerase